jgi:hypothetical protein
MPILKKPVAEYGTVQTWRSGYAKQWHITSEDQPALRALEQFCDFVGKDPDDIVSECLKDVEGGQKIRMKPRSFYIDKIKEFEAKVSSRVTANAVRSFFIHNGVAMGSEILQ